MQIESWSPWPSSVFRKEMELINLSKQACITYVFSFRTSVFMDLSFMQKLYTIHPTMFITYMQGQILDVKVGEVGGVWSRDPFKLIPYQGCWSSFWIGRKRRGDETMIFWTYVFCEVKCNKGYKGYHSSSCIENVWLVMNIIFWLSLLLSSVELFRPKFGVGWLGYGSQGRNYV